MDRRFWIAGLAIGGASFMASLVAGVIAFLWPVRRVSGEFDAGRVESFAVGDVQHFSVDAEKQGAEAPPPSSSLYGARDFHLVRRPDGFVAFWHRCSHMGCTVPFRPEMTHPNAPGRVGLFRCPCHGSTYSREEGELVFGPAPRSLDTLPVRIHNGRVIVTVRPGAERKRQRGESAKPAAA